jgi:hypothetical protein
MYSLFLFLATLSYLALLRAVDRGGLKSWSVWAIVMLLAISSHQYGALVLGSQGLYVLLTRSRLRQAIPAFAAVFLLAVPLWRSSLVLANRPGGRRRRGRRQLRRRTRCSRTSGTSPATPRRLHRRAASCSCSRSQARLAGSDAPRSALLTVCVVITPTLFFLVGRFGGTRRPSRAT